MDSIGVYDEITGFVDIHDTFLSKNLVGILNSRDDFDNFMSLIISNVPHKNELYKLRVIKLKGLSIRQRHRIHTYSRSKYMGIYSINERDGRTMCIEISTEYKNMLYNENHKIISNNIQDKKKLVELITSIVQNLFLDKKLIEKEIENNFDKYMEILKK